MSNQEDTMTTLTDTEFADSLIREFRVPVNETEREHLIGLLWAHDRARRVEWEADIRALADKWDAEATQSRLSGGDPNPRSSKKAHARALRAVLDGQAPTRKFDEFKARLLENPAVRAGYDEAKARRDGQAPTQEAPHQFTEDVGDGSMCVCGIPALTHDEVMARRPAPTQGVTGVEDGCTCGGMAACPQCQDRDAGQAPAQAEEMKPGSRCDMGCQPDWHHDECAIYLPAPTQAEEAGPTCAGCSQPLYDFNGLNTCGTRDCPGNIAASIPAPANEESEQR